MGCRGVLLSLAEGDSSGVFNVVCPDANLRLPSAAVLKDAPCVAEQKLVVADHVTMALQQVARLSGISLQPETRSALWVAAVPRADDDVPLLTVPLAGSAHAFSRLTSLQKVCYCFHFRSDAEFELFERAFTAAQRLQQYSLLEKSVLMELEIQRDLQRGASANGTRPKASPTSVDALGKRQEAVRSQALSRVNAQADAIRRRAAALEAQREAATRVDQAAESAPRHSQTSSKAAGRAPKASNHTSGEVEASPVDTSTLCILCGNDGSCRGAGGSFVKHPYVLKDVRGAAVMVCKICLQRVLKHRVANPARPGQSTRDRVCGLCSEPVADISGDLKSCAHPQCTRIYCSPCLKKLIGRAKAHKVWRTKHWHCPNCTTADGTPCAPPIANEHVHRSEEVVAVAVASSKKKKRKRQNEIKTEVEPAARKAASATVVGEAKTNAAMTPIDYAANYYEFLSQREAQHPPPVESEDVCFCCKDGGEVIECDWRANGRQCPKVYHEDCLGFTVGEDVNWVCPRHRCYKCGFAALYACRFCVTSYCATDLPKDIKKLGLASSELPKVTYVLCATCDKISLTAVEQGKLNGDAFDRILHPSKPKPKKRVR